MKKVFIFLLLTFFAAKSFAQADALVTEGIALHDKGDFSGAIAKYDEALQLDPSHCQALYEKSYTLMEVKQFDKAEKIVKQVLKDCKDPEYRRLSYINYGTLLDYQGQPKDAVKVYDKGIKEFPESYLLYYNKGVTMSALPEPEKTLECFEQSARLNPVHASSHNALGRTIHAKNRIPAILAYFTFLLLEPNSDRAKQNVEFLNSLIMKGISEKDDKTITINMDRAMLDVKNKKKEDDFSSVELILTFAAANKSLPDSLGLKTEADKLSYKMQLLSGMFKERVKADDGFFKKFYVPFFIELHDNNRLTTACYIALTSSGKDDIKEWLKANKDKVDEFYEWFDKYEWPNLNS